MNLVEVQFEPAGKVVLVAPGTTLLAAAEAAGLDIACGCRRGMCGTDAVCVSSQEALEAADATEKSTLERMGLPSDFRLSCSAKVRQGSLRVALDRF